MYDFAAVSPTRTIIRPTRQLGRCATLPKTQSRRPFDQCDKMKTYIRQGAEIGVERPITCTSAEILKRKAMLINHLESLLLKPRFPPCLRHDGLVIEAILIAICCN